MTQQRIILIAVGLGFLATLGWIWHERSAAPDLAAVGARLVTVPAPPAPLAAQSAPALAPASAPAQQPEAVQDAAPAAGNEATEADPMQEAAERKFAQGGKHNGNGNGNGNEE